VRLSPQEWRARLAIEAKHMCGYCLTQEAVSGIPLTLEHIIPLSKGGQTNESNLWLSCRLCNESKGVLIEFPDPQSGSNKPLYKPNTPNWNDHFQWSASGALIIGVTPIGRATIDALDLNNEFRIKSRAIWVEAGWHPPS
jgi:5-methylcytosine-specific restriction endonuclease McrA